MVLRYLVVISATHYYIIMAARTALHSFTVGNAKGSIASTKRHFVIKKTLLLFRKKFATASSRRRHLEEVNIYKKNSLSINIYTPHFLS